VLRQGKAAHIHSAGRRGPRSKPEMTASNCRALSNGIWLCDICARLVDDDEAAYPPATLQRWKSDAEKYVLELVTQDTRLRQLRGFVQHLLSAMRILTAVPGPGPRFDQTFVDGRTISWARQIIETEQVLFENEFLQEADTVRCIGEELQQVHGVIQRQAKGVCTDISEWKDRVVFRLMIEVMHFRSGAYERYKSREGELVRRHIFEMLSSGCTLRRLRSLAPLEIESIHSVDPAAEPVSGSVRSASVGRSEVLPRVSISPRRG
jgi:hypothetical protein